MPISRRHLLIGSAATAAVAAMPAAQAIAAVVEAPVRSTGPAMAGVHDYYDAEALRGVFRRRLFAEFLRERGTTCEEALGISLDDVDWVSLPRRAYVSPRKTEVA
jgi:hypothetical protein